MERFIERDWFFWGAIAVLLHQLAVMAYALLKWVFAVPFPLIKAAVLEMALVPQLLLILSLAFFVVYALMLAGVLRRSAGTVRLGKVLLVLTVVEIILTFQTLGGRSLGLSIGGEPTGAHYVEFLFKVIGKVINLGVIVGLTYLACQPRDAYRAQPLAAEGQ